MYWVVSQDGTKVAGPFNLRESALMALASHPTCKVVRVATP